MAIALSSHKRGEAQVERVAERLASVKVEESTYRCCICGQAVWGGRFLACQVCAQEWGLEGDRTYWPDWAHWLGNAERRRRRRMNHHRQEYSWLTWSDLERQRENPWDEKLIEALYATDGWDQIDMLLDCTNLLEGAKLTTIEGEALLLRLEERTMNQIGEILGVRREAIGLRLKRARKRILAEAERRKSREAAEEEGPQLVGIAI